MLASFRPPTVKHKRAILDGTDYVCYMFTLSRLPFLHAVHQLGSVGAAARELGYTSSAVSQQVGKLEREVGVPLLEPVGRGVVLTDAALALVDAATEIEAVREAARARLEALAGTMSGSLSVACFPSAIRGVAAPALAALAGTAPRLALRLKELSPEPALEAVTAGEVDVALVHDWVHDRTSFPAHLDTVHLADDPVDLLVPAAHPLAREAAVDLDQTVDDVWVTDVSHGICTRWILDMLDEATRGPRVHYRAEEYASQVELVAAGLCIGLLPRLGRPALPDTVRVVPVRGAVPTRRFLVVFRRTTTRRPAITALTRELEVRVSAASPR
jgi:DNA-binding transcriptional LysR family regulator